MWRPVRTGAPHRPALLKDCRPPPPGSAVQTPAEIHPFGLHGDASDETFPKAHIRLEGDPASRATSR